MQRFTFAGLAVTLLLIGGVAAGCTSLPAATSSSSPAPASTDDASSAYDMRLGEVVGSSPGTVKMSIYVPAFSSGVWLRVSALDGSFTRDVCQVAVEDSVQSSSDECSVEVFERDEHGKLQGVILHVDGLDEAGYFETDTRDLRRTEQGGWSGETGTRSVKLWGFLSPKGLEK